MTKKKFLAFSAILFLGCIILFLASYSKKQKSKIEWNGQAYNIEEVNPLDAKLARPYNKALDKTGDYFVALSSMLAGILVLYSFFSSKDKAKALKAFIFDLYTYMICYFYANGSFRILKTLAGRIRPYMYFENPSMKGIANYDFYRSWPSGHSANVFISVAFIVAWFVYNHSDSKLKKPSIIFAFLIGLTTMVLRMLSGNHFLTDVLSGALIGFFISYFMAFLCNYIYKKNNF